MARNKFGFDWIFTKDGKIAKGKECVLFATHSWEQDHCVVTLAGYWPYYTDGTPDPTRSTADDWCFIEVDGCKYESQVRLDQLAPLHRMPDNAMRYYEGKVWNVYGWCRWEGDIFYVLAFKDDMIVVGKECTQKVRHIDDLGRNNKLKLFYEVCRGSMYYSDYSNSLGVPNAEALSYMEGYYAWLYEEKWEGCKAAFLQQHPDEYKSDAAAADAFVNENDNIQSYKEYISLY